jgi:hypothetical protein
MWEARAEYADGTRVERLFESNPRKNENDEQYELECWLIERHDGCVWYSVNWIND